MSVQRENRPFFWDARAYSAEPFFLYPPEWNGCTGVPTLDALLDTRNVQVASNSAIAVKPVIQLAAVRADRPDDGLVVGGTWTGAAAAAGLLLFHEATILPATTKLLFRVGIGVKLTAGTFSALGTWIDDVPTGNDARNSDERSVSGLYPDDNHWFEPGVGVRKADGADPASRLIFRIITALKYS